MEPAAVGRRAFVFTLAGAGMHAACGAEPAQDAAAGGWQSLCNGKDLGGWKAPDPNPYWRVADGILIGDNSADKKSSMLYTEQTFADFVFEADARWQGEIDSGFMVRKPELQLQIGVSRSLKKDMTGSFYVGKYPEEAQAKNAAAILKPGDWNKFRLEAKGPVFTVRINDQPASSYTDPKYSGAGPIGLQLHGGLAMKIEFRNLRARALA